MTYGELSYRATKLYTKGKITLDKYMEMTKPLNREIEQEPKWISVRERLPEDGQSVLFCDIDDDIMVGYHVEGRPVTHFSQDGTYEDMKNVKAWMPLPEPYKAESEENNG